MGGTGVEGLSAQRVWDRCEALGGISELAGGLTRIYLSDQQRRANELVLGWMREAGMSARLDAIGNCVGRYEGDRPGLPCLMLGSHLDTVRDAGRYDGMLGVVAAIECVASLHARGVRLPFAVEVVGFADEEGVRFNATLLGSRAVAGTFKPQTLELQDRDGVTLGDALRRFGLDPALIPTAARRGREVLAYAELHIEQGPVLESEGLPVGVVTAISGASRYQIEIEGEAGHAGTVPMNLRKDALTAAAECVLEIERICGRSRGLVGTVGKLETLPGAVNVVPGRVRFTIDIRAPIDSMREEAAMAVFEAVARIGERRKVKVSAQKTHEGRTAPCAEWLMEQMAEAVEAEGVRVRQLPSGAGHDGMAMIELADIAMLFVRCARGISHNPAEAITLDDIDLSTRVFLRFIERFDPSRRP
jgi:allantoate deiminase